MEPLKRPDPLLESMAIPEMEEWLKRHRRDLQRQVRDLYSFTARRTEHDARRSGEKGKVIAQCFSFGSGITRYRFFLFWVDEQNGLASLLFHLFATAPSTGVPEARVVKGEHFPSVEVTLPEYLEGRIRRRHLLATVPLLRPGLPPRR